ncbi:MAG: hypothetical protein PHU71_02005 [Candidatus Gracilibacteria bacterium]|nr:hypothetical protein [Candidatus Gracilibacteria bacterium]
MDISRFSESSYWFAKSPGSDFALLYPVLFFSTILLVLGIALSVTLQFSPLPKALRPYLKKMSSRLYTFAIIAYLLSFFRYEGAILLSMRLWWLVYAVFFLIFLIQSILNLAVHYPLDIKKMHQQQKSKRYKPGKK